MGSTPMTLGAVLLLLIPWASAQARQCALNGSSQLRLVAQLSVSGCAVFVHDTGAKDYRSGHYIVEPLMCVTEGLHKIKPRFDNVVRQGYASVPVTLRDDAMLPRIQRQLEDMYLRPESLKFADVSEISASTDASSVFEPLGFTWSPGEPVGFLELGCKTSAQERCKIPSSIRKIKFEALDQMILSANITSGGNTSQFNYRLILQNRAYFDANINLGRLGKASICPPLSLAFSVRKSNCTARVYNDARGSFHIEPLLCHNITSMNGQLVTYDNSRDMYYLKLDVVLQDDILLSAVRIKLTGQTPFSLHFMSLWGAKSHVASVLSRRFIISPLMVSGDFKSAQLRVYCRTANECQQLRSAVIAEPLDFWKRIRYSMTSLTSDCLFKSEYPRHPWSLPESVTPKINATGPRCTETDDELCQVRLRCKSGSGSVVPQSTGVPSEVVVTRGGRKFLVIQQQTAGCVSFQRTWAEYERGFGDKTDFWIGLSTIHSRSMNGTTLRVEMKQWWDGTERHVEYAEFKVGDASTKYTMTYREMLKDRSSVSYDALEEHKEAPFSTMDRDNDRDDTGSCSQSFGKGGWWWHRCDGTWYNGNPNGIYNLGVSRDSKYCSWYTRPRWETLREVRLMLQI